MKIHFVCVEDGIIALGFRKMTAMAKSFNADTHTFYVPLSPRTLWSYLTAKEAEQNYSPHVRRIAEEVAGADLVCFSSMSDYAEMVAAIIADVRRINPHALTVWGGAHPIIVPEQAIEHADVVCTGEGELAFQELVDALRDGRDPTQVRNFWFRRGGEVIRTPFRPLMTGDEMSALPLLEYADPKERIYEPGRGFVPLTRDHYLTFNGLGYNTIWSIGCPFRCSYCGNTKFIENDKNYQRVRHPHVDYMVRELQQAIERHPFLNAVIFHDDSFMALRPEVLQEFAGAYAARVGLPFAVFGVIPNYVQEDKMDILVRAGMNRIRMGIQSGSARILEFYKRPSPPERVRRATDVIRRFTPYMIPPAYDIIVDNPIESKQDVEDTLRLVYELPRPFTLNLYSLRLMPNTTMAQQFAEMGIHGEDMADGYLHLAPTTANALLYLLCVVRPPRWLFERWLRKAQPFHVQQRMAPLLNRAMRALWLLARAFGHLRHMDFAKFPGGPGLVLHRIGFLSFWRRHLVRRYRPERASGRQLSQAHTAGSETPEPVEEAS